VILTVGEIAGAVAGVATADRSMSISSYGVDSRTMSPGGLYVAIRGERVDGHDYAAAAIAAGAVAIMSARQLSDEAGEPLPCIVVDDPVLALGRLAAWVRREKLTCAVVAITGSSGKTGTKDLVASVLSGVGETVSPAGSLNTEVGLPLTILSADESTGFLVLEMGMRGEGHISYLVDVARPDIGLVLNVGSAHLGMLGSREAIARAKGELVAGLAPDATAVLNDDDAFVREMAQLTSASVVTFGESVTADVRATDIRLDDMARPTFTLTDSRTLAAQSIGLQFSGEHYVSNAIAAAAVALSLGATLEQVADGLRSAVPASRWRMEVHVAPGGYTVINDAYNANPESMRVALKTLAAMAAGRRTWAVLGEMRELGESTVEEHDAIGRLAVRLDISRLVCVGEGTRVMHLGASNEGSWGEESAHVPDIDAAIDHLLAHVRPDDVVLVKASRSVGLERVADALLAAPAASGGSSE
jgi:UDP-N-acetylmuramoyl-tripeptide--D-alanyl-D-alanine ligase